MGVSPDKKAVFCQLSIYTKISTPPIRPEKWPNNRDKPASKGLQGVRDAARRDRQCRFTALLHHITPELLRPGQLLQAEPESRHRSGWGQLERL